MMNVFFTMDDTLTRAHEPAKPVYHRVISWNICDVKINNGNWTDWSTIWSEIMRVILNARVRFEITGMISD